VSLLEIPKFENNTSQVLWNAGDLSSGVYIWQLLGSEAEEKFKLETGKLILLK